MRLFVTIHAQVANARSGNKLQKAVHHAKASTQNGNDGEFLACDALTRHDLEGSLYLHVLQRKVAQSLVALKNRQLSHELAEILGWSVSVSQKGELVLHQRMVHHMQAAGIVVGHGSSLSIGS